MAGSSDAPTIRARLWDGPTRIVHWSLVALIGFAWWAGETHHMDWHRMAGYGVLGLLVFRLAWGFVGSGTARFANFVRAPAATLAYVRTLPSRAHADSHGHNPLGALSVLAILAALIVQVVSGLFTVDIDGLESGPLSDRVSFDTGRLFAKWHHQSFTALEVLVVLHIAAIIFYAVYKRADLVGPMVTGTGKFRRHPEISFAPAWRAILVAVVAGLIAWWATKGFRF
jgi:cytochrome b